MGRNAVKKTEKLKPLLRIETHNDQFQRASFSSDTITALQKTLSCLSNNVFADTIWNVTFSTSGKQTKIKFPADLDCVDGQILRASVLYYLSNYASSNCSKIITDSVQVLNFFAERKIKIENCTTGFVETFVNYLDGQPDLSPIQKNCYMQALARMVDICHSCGLITAPRVVDCSYRWKVKNEPRRAPESGVMLQLDSYFFDLLYDSIPLPYRTLYLVLRFILNRIDEPLNMGLDCLSYPAKDVFALAIPTSKESAFHVPELHYYNRKLSGKAESILHQCVFDMVNYATSHQDDTLPSSKGYLFITQRKNGKYSLVRDSDFNDYLRDFIVEHCILDSKGEVPTVTSHLFRHIGVVERMNYGIISGHDAMNEANHTSLEQTMDYNRKSKHDEAQNILNIMQNVFPSQFDTKVKEDPYVMPIQLPAFRFNALRDSAETKLLPGVGGIDGKNTQACAICTNPDPCKSGFAKCFKCEMFKPDPQYVGPIEAAVHDIQRKIQMLEARGGNPEAIKVNKKQLKTFMLFLDRCKERMS